MFTLKSRIPLFSHNNQQQQNQKNFIKNENFNKNKKCSMYRDAQNKTTSKPSSTFQLLLYLTDVHIFFFSKIATLFTVAWETIAFAWVTTLIQPDKYHPLYTPDDVNIYHRSSLRYQRRLCDNLNYQHQFDPITNVFDNWRRADHIMKKQKMFWRDSLNDDSSWGQFVDVDLTYHLPCATPKCFFYTLESKKEI